ncbi:MULTISPECIES: cbb3-type cytochrome oxidase assembly protein CcoS [Wohlfahrtiimonas]|uniref:Cbb3-type cytochrome oxidase assembly protein CcoS n=1 Tax=Wohlfahrtiimonas larvae TaxID=1157986 RepID=A0ABP9MHM9_9GAMM|nr:MULTISPECIES: cbb3-type cytochrome oxidase assembly protein CcoS [Wohlfahrtiimonas]
MKILYFLLPLSFLLLVFVAIAFVWAVRSKQFDDMEGPAHRILFDGEDDDFYRLGKDKEKTLEEKDEKK